MTQTLAAGTGLLEPPWDMHANITAAWVLIAVYAVSTIGTVVFMGFESVRHRSLVPIAILLGIGLASPVEPITDVLGAIWYPSDLPLSFELMGWTFPPMAWIAYPLMAPMYYLFYRLFTSGASLRKVGWCLVGMTLVLPPTLDCLFIYLDLMVYFGDNPTKIFGLPLYAAVVNGTVMLVIGAMITVTAPHLRGWQALWVAPLVGCGFIAYYVGTQWPVYVALHSRSPDTAIWLASLITIVFALAATWFAVHLPAIKRLRDAKTTTGSLPVTLASA